jgi:UDP-N-acetylglucosamine 4-epimerase
MTSRIDTVERTLREHPKTWLVTGAAGFIGSHLVERLLTLGQTVRGLDNYATGRPENLDDVHFTIGDDAFSRFTMIEGDIRDLDVAQDACKGADIVLHQAALGSVPRSIDDPLTSHAVNVDGFISMLVAARDAKVKNFVYASSSSVYGDEPTLPKVESRVGRVLSPYAATKAMNEAMASAFASAYGMHIVGLRYFNVIGSRQDPNGPYAAVLPRFASALLAGKPCVIFGDGETSRDFCPVENAVDANILAAHAPEAASGRAFNVACGEQTTLKQLFTALKETALDLSDDAKRSLVVHEDFRKGDIRHSLASIDEISSVLGYAPRVDVKTALKRTMIAYAAEQNAGEGA